MPIISYEQKPIVAPFKGIVSSSPKPYTPANSFDDILNYFLYRGRVISRNKTVAYSTSPDASNIYNLVPFTDVLGNLHNLILTAKNGYMLTAGPTWNGPLTYPAWDASITYQLNAAVVFGGTTYVATTSATNHQPDTHPTDWSPINPAVVDNGVPYNYELSGGRVYYSNGSQIGTYADGESTIKSMMHPGSFFFIGLLGEHLITANTIEPAPSIPTSAAYQNRVRWSDVGDATNWVEGGASSAGHKDLLDVPDAITGYATQGRTGFIYRSNGITMITPTGIGAAPFQFDQVSHAPKGVGNFYPYSLDVFGSLALFVASDDVYLFDASTFSAIGGDARDLIFADIAASPASQIIGTTVVRFSPSFLLLSYWLSIPISVDGTPVVWIYFWDSKGWVRFSTSIGSKKLTAIGPLVV